MQNNILIIGNGFDLYHGLPTRYTDFLFFARNWEKFKSAYDKQQKSGEVSKSGMLEIKLGGGKYTIG